LYVSNLSLDHLRDVLYTRLGRVYSGVRRSANATTRFDVSVANVRVNQVYVVGEVAQPGAYQISSLGTALTALYAAGGVTERANMRRIEIQRVGKTVATLDLYDYLLRGDTRSDIRLETGDVVFVPVHGTRVQVTGAVVRPAIYEVGSAQTLTDLIRAAGGFRADAALRRIAIHRILAVAEAPPGPAPRAVVDVALTLRATGSAGTTIHGTGQDATDPKNDMLIPAVVLQDGDSVVGGGAPEVPLEPYDNVLILRQPEFDFQRRVVITGEVRYPGRYALRTKTDRLVDVINRAGGLTAQAYPEGILFIRALNDV